MIQFNVQNISKYRGQLMGIATLLVIFGHSVGNGVAMPRWMESLCGLSSVGGRYIPPCKRFGAMVLAHKPEWK